MKSKTLQWIESVLFFLGWTAVMLKGADFPPPIGFIWVILTIAILSILQWYYLGKLLKIMPATLGQASRNPGVPPSDIQLVWVAIENAHRHKAGK